MLPHECDWPLPPGVPTLSILTVRGAPADAEQIDKDLHRAGRQALGVADADAAAHRESLRKVLYVWCSACAYSQAMSHVGASLVAAAALDAEDAYLSFAWLMSSLPPDYYGEGFRCAVL